MQIAGLIYDDSLQYLDHIAPFCSSLGVPLIVCEKNLYELAKKFYPDLQVQYESLWDLKLPQYTITCDGKLFLKAAFPHQSTKTIWLPHGHSDKGAACPSSSVKRV